MLPTIQKPVEVKQEEKKVEVPKPPVHIFVSNYNLSDFKDIESVFSCTQVHEYTTAFTNRTLEDLVEVGYDKIWINIKDKAAKAWFRKEIVEDAINPPLVIIPVYNHVKDTWIEDLEKLAEKLFDTFIPISVKKLAAVEALSFSEIIKHIKAQSLKISDPSCCYAVAAVKKFITKKE